MTVMTDVLIPALEDTREIHAETADRFRSDMTVTPAGPHRQALERHVADTQDHIAGIDRHVRQLRHHGPLRETAEIVRITAEVAVRTVALPLEIGVSIVGGLLRGGRRPDERRLLEKAEVEYTIAARALAVCRAGQSIAAQVDDEVAAGLLASLRRRDEELLEALEDSVADHGRAVAMADTDWPTQTEGSLAGAATRAVRTTAGRLGNAARNGGRQTARAAAGALREVPGVPRMAEEIRGAATREADLPIPDYGRRPVTEIIRRLRTLSQSQLTAVEGYERAHANRPGIRRAIERLRDNQPWPGYDGMTPDEIHARLQTAHPALAFQVLHYERRHRQRDTVITAAKRHTPT